MCQQGKPLAKTFARTHFATVCHADFYKTQDLKGLLLWEGAQFWIFFVGATILSGVSGKGVQIKQKCFFLWKVLILIHIRIAVAFPKLSWYLRCPLLSSEVKIVSKDA